MLQVTAAIAMPMIALAMPKEDRKTADALAMMLFFLARKSSIDERRDIGCWPLETGRANAITSPPRCRQQRDP
jgi:hypothetical protein